MEITTGEMERRQTKPRVYFFVKDESVLDNLSNRRNRPKNFYRTLLPEIYKKLGISELTKAVWSQKAGCRCGCSPGFILQDEDFAQDIFVDL